MQLNKVDAEIKQCLLRYPLIFKSRMDVLEHFFMTIGNDYAWDRNGCLVSSPREPVQEMCFADLERRRLVLEELQREGNRREGMEAFYASQAAQLKRQFAVRHLIADEIDLYAAEHVMGENMSYSTERMRQFDPAFSLVARAPFPALDPQWAAAAEETMSIARSAVWRHLEMYSEHFERETADPHWLSVYDKLEEILAKLAVVTGSRERHAQILEKFKLAISQGPAQGMVPSRAT